MSAALPNLTELIRWASDEPIALPRFDLCYAAAASYEVKDQNDQGNDEEEVNQPSADLQAESKQPQDHENY
jgi:hypothetical protein